MGQHGQISELCLEAEMHAFVLIAARLGSVDANQDGRPEEEEGGWSIHANRNAS